MYKRQVRLVYQDYLNDPRPENMPILEDLYHLLREQDEKEAQDVYKRQMEYFKSEVMEMCHREGLYQIDLLNGSKERITEREYWAAKKGQLALDKENAAREAAGQPTDVYKRQAQAA